MWRHLVLLNLSRLPQVSHEQDKHTRIQHAVYTSWWRRRTKTTAQTNQEAWSVLSEKETERCGRCAGPNYCPSSQAARNWPHVRERKAAPEGANAFVLNLPVQHSATARVNSRTVRKTTVFQLVQYMCSNRQLSNILYIFAYGCWQKCDASHMLFKLLFKTLYYFLFCVIDAQYWYRCTHWLIDITINMPMNVLCALEHN